MFTFTNRCLGAAIVESLIAIPSLRFTSRLSLSIYLVQTLVQYYRIYSIRDTYVMTFKGTVSLLKVQFTVSYLLFLSQQLEIFLFDFLLSIFFAYLLHLLFEAPARRLNELFSGETIQDCCRSPRKVKSSRSNSDSSISKSKASFPSSPISSESGDHYPNPQLFQERIESLYVVHKHVDGPTGVQRPSDATDSSTSRPTKPTPNGLVVVDSNIISIRF